MSGKDIILDFLNYIFILILLAFIVIFFIAGDNLGTLILILRALIVLSIFTVFLLIKTKFMRTEVKKRKEENDEEITLYLSYRDKIKSDLLIFFLPIILLLIPLIMNKITDWADIIQASTAFLLMLYWQKSLFKKK